MCKGGGDIPPPPELPAVQRAMMDNLYMNEFHRMPSDYQPTPKPHPKPKPNPLDYGVPDLDLD